MKPLQILLSLSIILSLSLADQWNAHFGKYGRRRPQKETAGRRELIKPLLRDFKGFKHDVTRGNEGVYKFGFHVGDSSRVEERTPSGEVEGNYAFVAPEGDEYKFTYAANDDGYHVEGDALPQAPEDTDEVKRAKEEFQREFEKIKERNRKYEEEEDDDDSDDDDSSSAYDSSYESSEEDDDDDDGQSLGYFHFRRRPLRRYFGNRNDDDDDDDDDDSSFESSEEDDDDSDEEEEEEEGRGRQIQASRSGGVRHHQQGRNTVQGKSSNSRALELAYNHFGIPSHRKARR